MVLWLTGGIKAQTVTLNDLCTFPALLYESSGIAVIDENRVLTHNDSGDPSRIFIYNHNTCSLEKQVYIRDHIAIDIESITLDDSGYVYVADMGNNLGSRTNLCILKMKLEEVQTQDTVDAQKIFFSYADQVSFSSTYHNFDAEAFFHHNDSLYLFSKNHGVAGAYCKLYVLPDVAGTYAVMPKDSIGLASWVTDAAIDPSHQHFILLSEQKLYLFGINAGVVDFGSPLHTLSFGFITQKEGVSFLNADSVLVTDELAFGFGGKVYLGDLSQWVGIENRDGYNEKIKVIRSGGFLEFSNSFSEVLQYSIFNMQGQMMGQGSLQPGQSFYNHYPQSGVLLLWVDNWKQVVKF